MRIVHLDSGAEMRGGQWQVLRLMEGLRGRGHENVLLARRGSPLAGEVQRRGFETHELTLLSVARWSRNAITHAHDARSHTAAALTGSARLVVSRRVAFPVQDNALSHWKYRRAAHYIAVSRFVERMLLDAGIAASRITVVYDGVPALPLSNGSEILAPHSEDPAKGTALAVEGARLAGCRVRISSHLEADLAQAEMLLYITHAEGLGSAALLAMAAGVPVIASNVGGLVEIVEHERTGLLTENTPEAIAAAIRRLHADRAHARSLGDQARLKAAERFSVDRMVADTVEVYEALR
jgi:Glycosyl transferases group 1/Glycosyltransferase Family 4